MSNRYVCKHCGREFPRWYWGVTGHAGGCGTVQKPGLAAANFRRHEEACSRKGTKETIEVKS